MQQELIAGDSLNFPTSTPGYPASAGWVLTYRLVPRTTGGDVIQLTATAEGDDHRTAVAASVTATWIAGAYTWVARVELAGEKYTVESGQIVIKPNPESLAVGYDGRSLAEKTLEDLMTAKATWDTTGGRQRRYKIGEREMEFNSETEIITKIHFWEAQVERDKADANAAKGLRPKNRILTRFTRPR